MGNDDNPLAPDCEHCDGTGRAHGTAYLADCEHCDGTGKVKRDPAIVDKARELTDKIISKAKAANDESPENTGQDDSDPHVVSPREALLRVVERHGFDLSAHARDVVCTGESFVMFLPHDTPEEKRAEVEHDCNAVMPEGLVVYVQRRGGGQGVEVTTTPLSPGVIPIASASPPILCVECGKPVEHARECYASPTCYACLPPPEPLPECEPAKIPSERVLLQQAHGAQREREAYRPKPRVEFGDDPVCESCGGDGAYRIVRDGEDPGPFRCNDCQAEPGPSPDDLPRATPTGNDCRPCGGTGRDGGYSALHDCPACEGTGKARDMESARCAACTYSGPGDASPCPPCSGPDRNPLADRLDEIATRNAALDEIRAVVPVLTKHETQALLAKCDRGSQHCFECPAFGCCDNTAIRVREPDDALVAMRERECVGVPVTFRDPITGETVDGERGPISEPTDRDWARESVFCTKCGQYNTHDADQCLRCGKSLDVERAAARDRQRGGMVPPRPTTPIALCPLQPGLGANLSSLLPKVDPLVVLDRVIDQTANGTPDEKETRAFLVSLRERLDDAEQDAAVLDALRESVAVIDGDGEEYAGESFMGDEQIKAALGWLGEITEGEPEPSFMPEQIRRALSNHLRVWRRVRARFYGALTRNNLEARAALDASDKAREEHEREIETMRDCLTVRRVKLIALGQERDAYRYSAAYWWTHYQRAVNETVPKATDPEVRALVPGVQDGAEWREAIEWALGVEPDPEEHTTEWAKELVRAVREIGNKAHVEAETMRRVARGIFGNANDPVLVEAIEHAKRDRLGLMPEDQPRLVGWLEELRLRRAKAREPAFDPTKPARLVNMPDDTVNTLTQEVVERARWWRDHPGAPGKKLIDALYRLDAAEGKEAAKPDPLFCGDCGALSFRTFGAHCEGYDVLLTAHERNDGFDVERCDECVKARAGIDPAAPTHDEQGNPLSLGFMRCHFPASDKGDAPDDDQACPRCGCRLGDADYCPHCAKFAPVDGKGDVMKLAQCVGVGPDEKTKRTLSDMSEAELRVAARIMRPRGPLSTKADMRAALAPFGLEVVTLDDGDGVVTVGVSGSDPDTLPAIERELQESMPATLRLSLVPVPAHPYR